MRDKQRQRGGTGKAFEQEMHKKTDTQTDGQADTEAGRHKQIEIDREEACMHKQIDREKDKLKQIERDREETCIYR